MPTVTLNRKVFEKLLGRKLSDDKLKEKISMIGTDLESLSKDEIIVEIFPDRPDMLSEQGFSRAMSSFLGVKKGLRNYSVKKSGTHTKVGKVLKIWPYVVTAIVKNLKFDNEKIRGVIQVQEKLHTTLMRKRKKGGLGIYPLDKVKPPITFTTMDADKIRFSPLEYPHVITGRQVLSKHATGRKYGYIIENEKEFPVFIDSAGTIMSMPPIINSHDVGKITEDTADIFIEGTGPDLKALIVSMNILVTMFADMGGTIYSMEVVHGKKKMVTPDLRPNLMKIDLNHVNKLLGLGLNEKQMKNCLEMMGYGYANKKVLVPAYRDDVIHEVDLIEDVSIAYGYDNFKEEIPAVATIAEEDRFYRFKSNVAGILAGLGLIEVVTYHVTNDDVQNKRMKTRIPLIPLLDSCSHEHDALRAWMIPSCLQVLSENKHREYPHNIFGIGTVFKKGGGETRVNENERLCIALCAKDSGFTSIKQMLDYLFNGIDMSYSIREVEHASFIRGRVGRVSVNGKDVAYMGEISPEVLSNWQLEMPVAVLELNLTDLFGVR